MWTILGLATLAIVIVAIRALFKLNKNWANFSVNHKEQRKNEACDITGCVPRAEYKMKDKELSKLLGKSHTGRLPKGGE